MLKVLYFIVVLINISSASALETSGKLLLTGGVSQIEGAGGGGLTPWAFIGGYGTKDQIGANAFHTNVFISDYKLESAGAMIGLFDRVELSVARMIFDTKDVGQTLGLKRSYLLKQNIFGIKVKLLGDGVLDQDTWLPQISIGAFYKRNQHEAVVRSLGATNYRGTDFYLAMTKIFLNQSILVNTTLRSTTSNQLGLLGFGGNANNDREIHIEGSLAYLVLQNLASGIEFRSKPNNLRVAKEENWGDFFVAWAPTKNISLTAAYALLGNIALRDNQTAYYTSLQVGF